MEMQRPMNLRGRSRALPSFPSGTRVEAIRGESEARICCFTAPEADAGRVESANCPKRSAHSSFAGLSAIRQSGRTNQQIDILISSSDFISSPSPIKLRFQVT